MQPQQPERHDSNLTKEESLRVGLVDRALMAQVTLLKVALQRGWAGGSRFFFGGGKGRGCFLYYSRNLL